MRLAVVGVKPDTVDRCTLCPTTPMLSVAAVQVRLADPIEPVALSEVGADGGCESSDGEGKRTIRATEGTPFVLTINSRYCPGGARFAFAGAWRVRPPPA